MNTSQSNPPPPNTGDTDIDEILETLQQGINEQPGVTTEIGWEMEGERQQELVGTAKAAIEQKLAEARLDELDRIGDTDSTGKDLLTHTDREHNGYSKVITVKERVEMLQATKEGNHGG